MAEKPVLVEGASYRIEGNFYKRVYNPYRYFFEGLIVGGAESFGGVLVDELGPSRIIAGSVKHVGLRDVLEFKKEYDVSHRQYRGGSKELIQYRLMKASSGGWTGNWQVGEDSGLVTMAIVPWEDDHPVSSDLWDYIRLCEAVKDFRTKRA